MSYMYVHEKFMVGPDKPAISGQLFPACQLSSAGYTHNLSGTQPALYTYTIHKVYHND